MSFCRDSKHMKWFVVLLGTAYLLSLVGRSDALVIKMDRVEPHLSKEEKRLKKYMEDKGGQFIHNAAFEAGMDAKLGGKFGSIDKIAADGAKVLLDHPHLDMKMLREHTKGKHHPISKHQYLMSKLAHDPKSHQDKRVMEAAVLDLVGKETSEEEHLVAKQQKEKAHVMEELKEQNLHVTWTPLTEEQAKIHYMEPKAEHLLGLKALQQQKIAQIVAHEKIVEAKHNKPGYRWHGLGEFFRLAEYVPDYETKIVEDEMGKITAEDIRKEAEKKYQREHAIKNYVKVLSRGGDPDTVRILSQIEQERQYAQRDRKLLNLLRNHNVMPGGMIQWGKKQKKYY